MGVTIGLEGTGEIQVKPFDVALHPFLAFRSYFFKRIEFDLVFSGVDIFLLDVVALS
jgi:hypothetical protein